jgi:hypothetical protein
MPAGSTATISVESFRIQWDAGVPMCVLCATWSITKDQIIRLKDVWSLPLRHDRARKRLPIERPSLRELRASEASLALSPAVAIRASAIRTAWTLEVEHSRRGSHSGGHPVSPPRVISMASLGHVAAEPADDEG